MRLLLFSSKEEERGNSMGLILEARRVYWLFVCFWIRGWKEEGRFRMVHEGLRMILDGEGNLEFLLLVPSLSTRLGLFFL